VPATNANWYHRDQASWRNAGGFDRTIIDDPGLATADATEKIGLSERKRCRSGSVDKLSRIFLPHRHKQSPVELQSMCAAPLLARTDEQPEAVTDGELHDRFHQDAANECILRKLPGIMCKLAPSVTDRWLAPKFSRRKSIEKWRD
jgi:hypothetical protein